MLNLAAISSSRHHSLSAYTGCRSIAADGLKTEYPISFKNAGFRPLKFGRAPGATAPAGREISTIGREPGTGLSSTSKKNAAGQRTRSARRPTSARGVGGHAATEDAA